MEKVYVATAEWGYYEEHAAHVLGVFSDVEKAKKACENYSKKYKINEDDNCYDYDFTEDDFNGYNIVTYILNNECTPMESFIMHDRNEVLECKWCKHFKITENCWNCERDCEECDKKAP